MNTRRQRSGKSGLCTEIVSCFANQGKAKPNSSKRRRLEKQGQLHSNWYDLPLDILELIIVHLPWADRIRLRSVCKAWSVSNSHIPTIDKFPWAMGYNRWQSTYNGEIYGKCPMLDPLSSKCYFSDEEVKVVKGKDCEFTFRGTACASKYGWVLFKNYELGQNSFFLYSPFTNEVIQLSVLLLGKPNAILKATFTLNATSPKCVIFILRNHMGKIYVSLCSAGDSSWKTFKFSYFHWSSYVLDVTYVAGSLYCVFSNGELAAFNVELEEWTILADHHPLLELDFRGFKFISSDADLWLLSPNDSKFFKLLKFDFSEMHWVYEKNLNDHILFIGCASFSIPAVGEASILANTIFSCCSRHAMVKCYGTTSHCRLQRSLLYRRLIEATKFAEVWIELPLGGIRTANDLINAV